MVAKYGSWLTSSAGRSRLALRDSVRVLSLGPVYHCWPVIRLLRP